MSQPPARGTAAVDALRRRAARRAAQGLAPGATAPPLPDLLATPAAATRPVRPRTPAQTLWLDGATIAGAVTVALGFLVLFLGWKGGAATLDVQVQTSYLVSGGIAGVVLIGVGCALLTIQVDRFTSAVEDRAIRRLAREWTDLGSAVTAFGEALDQAREHGGVAAGARR